VTMLFHVGLLSMIVLGTIAGASALTSQSCLDLSGKIANCLLWLVDHGSPSERAALIRLCRFPQWTGLELDVDVSTGTNESPISSLSWQSFTPNVTGSLQVFAIDFKCAGICTLLLSIYAGEGLDGTLLGSASYTSSEDDSGFVNMTFITAPIDVSQGSLYSFGIDTTEFLTLRRSDVAYAGGQFREGLDTTPYDMKMQAYIVPTLDACAMSTLNVCGSHSQCTSTGHCTFDCACDDHYESPSSDGLNCQHIDPCLLASCASDEYCQVVDTDSYTCGSYQHSSAISFECHKTCSHCLCLVYSLQNRILGVQYRQ
jgi:hypothetical protein